VENKTNNLLDTNQPAKPIWRSELFRLSAFVFPGQSIDASTWWETIAGEPPENQNLQPRAGTRQEEGLYEGGRLVLTVQPDRIDWLFIPAFDKQTGSPAYERLPEYDSALKIFRKVVERWLEISPRLSRLAFGAILNFAVPDRPTGYRLLSNYLHNVQLDPDNSSDFHYQINRRRLSNKISGLALNRLSKWSVNIAKFSQLAIGSVVQEFLISDHEHIFAHLELDINTVPEHQNLVSNEQLSVIFSELVELASEIANQGDVP